jgi:hypothetical protein
MADWLHTIANGLAVLAIIGLIAILAIASAPSALPPV